MEIDWLFPSEWDKRRQRTNVPTYEQWKYCSYEGCKDVASYEDTNWTLDSTNPRFLCQSHMDQVDDEEEGVVSSDQSLPNLGR